MWIVIVRSPKTGWSMLWCINSATHSLFSTSWKHLLQRKPSPMGRWMDGSSLQMSHGGPKCSMANSYLVLMIWEKVNAEVQHGHCIRVASTLSHGSCGWGITPIHSSPQWSTCVSSPCKIVPIGHHPRPWRINIRTADPSMQKPVGVTCAARAICRKTISKHVLNNVACNSGLA